MRGRTAKGLLRLAQQQGRTSKEGIRLSVTTSQRELGAYLALSRENVSRQLGWLRDAGVIDVVGSQIIIKDEQGLASIADEMALTDCSAKKTPDTPVATVSVAPPRPKATTGRPLAIASTGTIPKSSSPGKIKARHLA
jgi:hypothetical protein